MLKSQGFPAVCHGESDVRFDASFFLHVVILLAKADVDFSVSG